MNVRPMFRQASRASSILAAVAAFFAFSSVALGAGVAIVSGPSVQDSELTATSAVVRWRTDVESTTVVRFGTTTALGQEYKKIVPIEETEITEVVHTMTLAGLQPDTTYFYVARSATADASVDSPMLTFHTKASCDADVWACGEWGQCDAATSRQTRSCTMTKECPDVATPKPAESQTCTPACTADVWECTAYGACTRSSDGSYDQARTCTLKTDCPTATTPKPAESQGCTPVCTADTWSCTAYGACDADKKTQARTCTMTVDCPTATTPKPAESRACTVATPPPAPPPAPSPEPTPPPPPTCTADLWECGIWGECIADGSGAHFRTRNCTRSSDCPNVETASPSHTEACEPVPPTGDDGSVTPGSAEAGLNDALDEDAALTVSLASEGAIDPNSPPDPPYAVTLVGIGGDAAKDLVRECRDHHVLAGFCSAWLEAKYQDRRCLDAGKTSHEACEGYLQGLNGGTFPGCEGRTDTECGAIKARALIGYLPEDSKRKFDAALQGALDAGRPVEVIDGLTAVSPDAAHDAIWWPSLADEGQGSAPAMVIFDLDKDGLPDDLEKRLGWDPASSDTEGSSKLTRAVLKSFFEAGDTPTQFVFIDVDGNGSLDLVEDRKLLGLKNYDPSRVYLPGDTSKRVINMLTPFFGDDGDMSAKLGVDLDGDGQLDAKLSRDVIKTFFEAGDKPTASQFGSMIDSSAFAPADLALITGQAIGQPVGAGETDPSFTVTVDSDVDQPVLGKLVEDVNQPSVLGSGNDTNGRSRCNIDKECPPEYPQCVDHRCIGDGYDANLPVPPDQGGETGDGSGFTLSGRAAPNSVVIIYVYSYVPMVLTTTTDENGNYTYDVSDNVVDGEHTAYVAITDETGKVTKKSGALSFFVKEARAVTQDDFYADSSANVPTEPVAQWQRSYLIGAAVAVLVGLLAVWLFVARKLGPGAPQPPAEPPKA